MKEKDQEANVTMEDTIRNICFYFVMACTSHITMYAGHRLNYTKCSAFVTSCSQDSMTIVGKGNVIMQFVVRAGSVSSFCICDFLHVPKLVHRLISWRRLQTKE